MPQKTNTTFKIGVKEFTSNNPSGGLQFLTLGDHPTIGENGEFYCSHIAESSARANFLYEKYIPYIVDINYYYLNEEGEEGSASGSGWIYNYNNETYVITCAHVGNFSDKRETSNSSNFVIKNSRITGDMIGTFYNSITEKNESYKLLPVALDMRADIMILRLLTYYKSNVEKDNSFVNINNGDYGFNHIKKNEEIKIGTSCYIIGFPLADDSQSISQGSVRDEKYLNLQTAIECLFVNAPIHGGNSGGPIIDNSGDIIGMVSFGSSGYETMGGGPNAHTLKSILPKLFLNAPKNYYSELVPYESNITSIEDQTTFEITTTGFTSPYYQYKNLSNNYSSLNTLELNLHQTYTFTVASTSNLNSHPFAISDTGRNQPPSNKVNIVYSNGLSYSKGITSSSHSIQVTINEKIDNLFYYCTNHSNMENNFVLPNLIMASNNALPKSTLNIKCVKVTSYYIRNYNSLKNKFLNTGNNNVFEPMGLYVFNVDNNNKFELADVIVSMSYTPNVTYDPNWTTSSSDPSKSEEITIPISSWNNGYSYSRVLWNVNRTNVSTLKVTVIRGNSLITLTFSENDWGQNINYMSEDKDTILATDGTLNKNDPLNI